MKGIPLLIGLVLCLLPLSAQAQNGHLNQEMEHSEDGYLTGNFYWTGCGEHVVKSV